MIRHLHDISGGSVLTAPSPADFASAETGPYVEKYLRTVAGVDAQYRSRLFHAIRDYTADRFGGWQQVSTLQSGGGLFAQQLVAAKHYDLTRAKRMELKIADLPIDPAEAGSICEIRCRFGCLRHRLYFARSRGGRQSETGEFRRILTDVVGPYRCSL